MPDAAKVPVDPEILLGLWYERHGDATHTFYEDTTDTLEISLGAMIARTEEIKHERRAHLHIYESKTKTFKVDCYLASIACNILGTPLTVYMARVQLNEPDPT